MNLIHTNLTRPDTAGSLTIPGWMKAFGLLWTVALVGFNLWVIYYATGGRPASNPPIAESAIWWSQQGAGWWGAVLGSSAGVLGGLLGTMAGIAGSLSGTGKSRGAVMVIINIVIAGFALAGIAGVAALIAGIVAWSQEQPWHVHYPLLLIGGILTLVFGALAPWMAWMKTNVIAKRYEQHELRQMRAQDAG